MLGNYQEIRKRETENSWQEVCYRPRSSGSALMNTE